MKSKMAATWLATAGLAAVGVAGCGGSGGSGSAGGSGGSSGGSGNSGKVASTAASNGYSYGSAASSSHTALASSTAKSSSASTTVTSKTVSGLGKVLAAGPKHLTLYMFAADKAGKSNCNGSCTAIWPPLAAAGALKGAGGVSSSALGTITRSNGDKQVTYHGHPLYYYAADSSAADALGEDVDSFGAHWYVLSPSGREVTKG